MASAPAPPDFDVRQPPPDFDVRQRGACSVKHWLFEIGRDARGKAVPTRLVDLSGLSGTFGVGRRTELIQGATVRRIDQRRLQTACDRLGEVVIDPAQWPDVMAALCSAIGATGAALLQSDVRSPDVPRTASVDELFRSYFQHHLHLRDRRAERAVPLLLNGARVVVDQDILKPEEIRRDEFYHEALIPFGFQWFAVVGVQAGAAHWGLSFQRTVGEGPFSLRDKPALANIAPRLSEAATLSAAVGRAALTSATNALSGLRHAAVAIDGRGHILDANSLIEKMIGKDLHIDGRRLIIRDVQARTRFEAVLARLQAAPDTAPLQAKPIVIRRSKKGPLIARTLPVPCAARSPFLGARALLVLTPIDTTIDLDPAVLKTLFALTPAEARLATIFASGLDLTLVAEALGVSIVTVRNQLRAIFAKTDTHRQSELIALLSRL